MMIAKFKAKDTFAIENIGFVISGTILSGTIKKGMTARIILNSSLSVDIPIHSVETVFRKGGGEDTGLLAKGTKDEIDLWKGLNIGGEELDIIDETTAPTNGCSRC